MGVLRDHEKNHEAALREHTRATQLAPECVRCWNNLGFSLFLAGRDHDAVAAYERALRLDPGQKTIYNNLGFAYARLGDAAAAARAFEQAGTREQNLAVVKKEIH